MKKTILIYIQHQKGKPESVSLELIGKAFELSKKEACHIVGIAIGGDGRKIAESLFGMPIEKVYHYKIDSVYNDNLSVYAQAVVQLSREIFPDIVLIGATREGRALAPYGAAMLETGLTADCTQLKITEASELLQIRPAFEEKLLAHIITRTLPQMATVRPGIMNIPQKICVPEVILEERELHCREVAAGSMVTGSENVENHRDVDIRTAKILVVLGAGVTNRDDIPVFEKWAKSLGGEIACSRKLVERGWFTVERQVGLSGNAVQADCMIAIGVSGSLQFQAGIRHVKKLIAVNVDRDTPIFQIADFSVLLDLNTLAEELRDGKEQSYEGDAGTI